MQAKTQTYPGETANRFYFSEADVLTDTRFYFAEQDGCYACGEHFSALDASNGIEWIADHPVHQSCRAEYEAGYDDWRGVATL
jgi:hypothetical protein